MIPGGVNELLLRSAAAGGATAGRSVRFNAPDSAYLSRTPASAGNQKLWTLSFWYKAVLQDASNRRHIFTARDGSGNHAVLNFRGSDDKLEIYYYAGSLQFQVLTTAIFRDPSAWYHVVVTYDTDQATASNRIKLYVNGTQITAFDTANYPTSGYSSALWNSTNAHAIGRENTVYLSGYLALVHFIDGQALTPSSFGETSATTGQWIAKTYGGTYGTNGFFLDFLDNSTAAALGYDAAGSNDWTVNNLSVTAGSGNDSLRDHPTSAGTSTGLGGEVAGNYSTFNPLQKNTNITLTNGNLDCSGSGVYSALTTIYFPSSGKYYAEFLINGTSSGYPAVGILAPNDAGLTAYANPSTGAVYFQGGYITRDGSTVVSSLTQLSANDIVRVAYDPSTRNVWFALNGGSWVGGGNPATGSTPSTTLNANDRGYCFGASVYTSAGVTINTGQRAFAYTAPSGFSPLVDTLLPTPTIAKPNTVMDVALYTGNGSSQSVTGLGFSPDLAWIKRRGVNSDHNLFDTVRGATKVIKSNNTDAEVTASTSLTAFNSDGFTVGSNSDVNGNTHAIVAWTWDAGSSNATNTSGTITSTVRANISAGFSIITLTTPASTGNYSVGHGLGIKPAFTIWKSRTTAGNYWFCQHQGLGNMVDYYIRLESTAAGAYSAGRWVNEPTSSLLYTNVGNTWNTSDNLVCYAWAPVAGYSAFGSYTGTGDPNGPFVHTGFRVRWLMVKVTNSAGYNWVIMDAQRSSYNAASHILSPNVSNAEYTDAAFDFLSNGFKPVKSSAETNGNGYTYVYAAFAEAPFPYARAR